MDYQTLQLILTIGGVVTFIALLAGGVGLAINAFRKRPRDEKNEVVNSANTIMEFWKNQAEQYKLIIDEKDRTHNEKITDLTRQVGELRGQLNAETSQKKEYLAILQNRDPETKKFMEHMVNATENQDKILAEIFKMVKDEHDRELKVTSTISKDGQ